MYTAKNRKLRVFLCHSKGDKTKVRTLYRRLIIDGFDAWLDQERLLPGQNWEMEIRKAVKDADIVVIFLSQGSVTKAGYVQKEIKFALDVADEQPEGAIFIIPAKLEECQVPLKLSSWQWVNLFETRGYQKLKRSLLERSEVLGIQVVPVQQAKHIVDTDLEQSSQTYRETHVRPKILVMDNDLDYLKTISYFLAYAGYDVLEASTVDEAVKVLKNKPVRLAILDSRPSDDDNEKDISGSILAEQPKYATIPKIWLTGYSSSLIGEVTSIDGDALPIDFVTKSEGPQRLLESVQLMLSYLMIDNASSSVYVGNIEAHLPARPFRLLQYLYRNANKVCSNEELIEKALGQVHHGVFPQLLVLNELISVIRQAIGEDSTQPRYLFTVPGVGFRLVTQPPPI